MLTARVAHRTVGRLRLKLDGVLSEADTKKFVNDLKVSPEVAKVTVRGSSIIIEHTHDNSSETALSGVLNETFPGFKDWSNDLDEHVAKVTADPWVNKLIPFAFLGLAVFKGINSGAVLAGESAFALGYVAFDL